MICTHRHSRTGSVYTRRGTPAPGAGAPPLAVGYLTSTYTVLPVTVVVGWSAPGTPESVRLYVWPGRTATTVAWYSWLAPSRLTMTL